MTTCQNHGCGKTAAWTICRPCAEKLRKHIAELPALAGHLETSYARLTSRAQQPGGASSDRPVPYNGRASKILVQLHHGLAVRIKALCANQPAPTIGPICHDCTHATCGPIRRGAFVEPAPTVPAMSRWLLARLPDIVVHPDAADVYSEIQQLTERGWRAVDRPAEVVFVGPCDCGADLLVDPTKTETECGDCGQVHNIAQRLQGALNALDDRLVTAAEYANMLVTLGQPVNRERTRTLVNVWAHRGLIATHPGPTYRFGELQKRMTERAERRRA